MSPKEVKAEKKGRYLAQVTTTEVTQVREDRDQRTSRTDWIPFFKESDNLYVNDLALRALRSPTHSAVLCSKHTYTIADGLVDEDNSPVNGLGESMTEVMSKVFKDFIYFGNAYMKVINRGGGVFYLHVDATTVRKSRSGDEFFMSSWWREIKNSPNFDRKRFPVETIKEWTPGARGETLVHFKSYTPEYEVYGMPDYIGALRWADIEYRIPSFNLGRFDRGFMPAASLQLVGEPPEGLTPDQYAAKIRDNFIGEDRDHKLLIEFIDSPEQAMIYNEFENLREGEFMELDELASRRIVAGHSWYPSLSGLVIPGSLGDRQAIRTEHEIAVNAVVIPRYRRPVLSKLEQVLGQEVEVIETQPVSVSEQVDPKMIMTINEMREIIGLDPITDGDKLMNNGRVNDTSGGNS